jgi:GxxExxY protein
MSFDPLSEKVEEVATKIVDAAYTVHRALEPGLVERIYEVCFCHELSKRGLGSQRQLELPIVYDGIVFDEGLRLDVLVEGLVICELKAAETENPVWKAQLLIYLKLTGKRLGFLINFNVPRIKDGIQRIILRSLCLCVFVAGSLSGRGLWKERERWVSSYLRCATSQSGFRASLR